MERLYESSQVAESGSSDRARRPLWHDQPGAAFEEPEPNRRWSSAPSSSSPSPTSTQLPGAGREEGSGSSAAADAEQAVNLAVEADQHQFSQAERFADPRTTHGAGWTTPRVGRTDTGSCAAASASAAYAPEHAAEPPSLELRAGRCDGSQRPSAA